MPIPPIGSDTSVVPPPLGSGGTSAPPLHSPWANGPDAYPRPPHTYEYGLEDDTPQTPQWKWTGLVGWDDRRRPTQSLSNITISGSALGWPLPIIYGTARISGQLIMAHKPASGPGSSYVHCAYALCEGGGTIASPRITLADFKLNDEAFPFSGSATWAYGFSSVWTATPNDGSDSATSEVFNGATNQGIHTGLQSLPNVNWDTRLPGTAWAYLRIDPLYSPGGIPQLTCVATRADIDDWNVPANSRHSHNPAIALWDFMNTVLGVAKTEIDVTSWDAAYTWCETQGWQINIALQASSTLDAIDTIRQHGFLLRPYWWDGKWYLAFRGALGAADLTLTDDDLVTSPTWQTVPFTERPNRCTVYYTETSGYTQVSETSEADSVALKDLRAVEVTLPGCTSATMAFRWAETYRKLLSLEYQRIRFTAGPAAITAAPGAHIALTSQVWGDTSKALRVMAATYNTGDQTVDLECVNYASAAISSGTKSGDTVSTRGSNYVTDVSTISDVAYTFAHYSTGSGYGVRLSSEAHALGSWSDASNITVTADATDGPTGLAAGAADKITADANNGYIGGPAVIDITTSGGPTRVAFCFLKENDAADLEVTISDNSDSAATARDVVVKQWWRWFPSRRISAGAGNNAAVRILLKTKNDDIYVCGAGAICLEDYSYSYLERITWTAPVDTSGIDRVVLLYQTASGGQWIEHCSSPVSAEELTWGTSQHAQASPLPEQWYDWKLAIVATSGATFDAPEPGSSTYTNEDGASPFWPYAYIGTLANHTAFSSAGLISVEGNARHWDSEQLPLKAWRLGSTAPAEDSTSNFYALRFDRATEESIYLAWSIPWNYYDGADLRLYVDFVVDHPPAGGGGNEVVQWGLEAKKVSEGDTLGFIAGTATDTTTETITAGEAANTLHRLYLDFTDAGYSAGDLVLMRLYRDSDDAADTYDNEASNDDNDAWLVSTRIFWLCGSV